MSGMQRRKGASGELEAAGLIRDLTGWDVRRRVRQHDGDSDLTGVPGWSIEIKRHATATAGDVAAWWVQTVAQADRAGALPLLLFRLDRCEWRSVWPAGILMLNKPAAAWRGIDWTATTTPAAWAAAARECVLSAGIVAPASFCSTPRHEAPAPHRHDFPAPRAVTGPDPGRRATAPGLLTQADTG